MKFDDIFHHIGDIGPYQILLVFLVGLLEIFSDTLLYNFLAARVDHWCYIPELQHLDINFQKNFSIPRDTDGNYEECIMYDLNYTAYNNLTSYDFAGNMSGLPTVGCKYGWLYDRSEFTETIVSSVS